MLLQHYIQCSACHTRQPSAVPIYRRDYQERHGFMVLGCRCAVTVGLPCIYIILGRILISVRTYLGFQHDIALNPRAFLICWDWTSEYENCAFVYFQRVSPFLLPPPYTGQYRNLLLRTYEHQVYLNAVAYLSKYGQSGCLPFRRCPMLGCGTI
jgi:hypothetical protein